MSSGLEIPGQFRVNVNEMGGPGAFPQAFSVQTNKGLDFNICGGLNKLEYAAIHIKAANPSMPVDTAVHLAAAVLQECAKPVSTPVA